MAENHNALLDLEIYIFSKKVALLVSSWINQITIVGPSLEKILLAVSEQNTLFPPPLEKIRPTPMTVGTVVPIYFGTPVGIIMNQLHYNWHCCFHNSFVWTAALL